MIYDFYEIWYDIFTSYCLSMFDPIFFSYCHSIFDPTFYLVSPLSIFYYIFIPRIIYLWLYTYLILSFYLILPLDFWSSRSSSRSSRIFARSLSLKTVSSFLHNKKKIIVFYYFSWAPTGSEGVNKVRVKIWYKFQDTWVVSIFRYVYGQQKTHTASCKFCQCVSKSTTFWYIIILFILYI